MKKFLTILLSLLLFSLVFLFVNNTLSRTQGGYVFQEEYVPNEVLVRFKKGVSKYLIQEAIDSIEGKIITYPGKEISTFQWDPNISSLRSFRLDSDLLHIKVPEFIGTELAVYLISQSPIVENVEKNTIYHFDEEPNDPDFDLLWGLHNTGQTGGTGDADTDAPQAWNICTGRGIVVAVLDSGVDYNHEDLQQNIWINEDEIPDNEIDDDQNGLIDDYYGWDFVGPGGDKDPMDENGHGTHVAGILGAMGDNNKGVTGVNWEVQIMVLRVGDQGPIKASIIKAIEYAIVMNADLYNCSWGFKEDSPEIKNAIEEAGDAGQLFIFTAGNNECDVDSEGNQHYPCCYNLDNIICVASTNHDDGLSDFSSWGSESVDLAAPGGEGKGEEPDEDDIYSTVPENIFEVKYAYQKGTSMAAPYVSGAAALIWGFYSGLSYQQVKNKIMNGVDELSSLSGKCVSGGRLNIHKALIPKAPSNLDAAPRAWTEIKLWWQDNSDDEQGFNIYRKYDPYDFSKIATVGENVTTYRNNTCTAGTTYSYRVKAYKSTVESLESNTDSATIPTDPPDAPNSLDAKFRDEQVCFTWSDGSNNEQGFEIERKSEWDPFWEEIGEVGPNETEFYDDNLEPDTMYYYRVRAYNPYGYSPYSARPANVYVPPWELR